MSTIAYAWDKSTPPKPDVYMTRRGTSNYLTIRYWDGVRWQEIQWTRSRSKAPFEWPKKAGVKFPHGHMSRYRATMGLRAINVKQEVIQWGTPYKVYNEKELIACLVEGKVLPPDWKAQTQALMRRRDARAAATKGGAACAG